MRLPLNASALPRYRHEASGTDVTYLRFAFACRALAHQPTRPLDRGIVRAVWLDVDELRACRDAHRSPLVMQSVDDYLAGKRFALDLIHTHPNFTNNITCLVLAATW